MSYKFDSLISVLNKIDRREKVNVQSLIDELEISERTAYRYMQTLQAGFPIIFDRKKQSYVFSENYSLGKPNLTVEETLALALSKNLLKSFGETMEKSIQSIQEKLSIKNSEVPAHIVLPEIEIPPQVGIYLGRINEAKNNFRKIEIVYKSLYSDEETIRKVNPYYLFYQEGFWHLRAYCHLREDFRTFALDRIVSLKVLNEHFLPKRISSEEELSGSFGTIIDGTPVEVVLRFDPDIEQYILRKKWHQSQKTKELGNGKLEVSFQVNGIEGIKDWIYRWIPYVEVLEPTELKELFKSDIQKAAKRFK
jgi:predicted DNA-binding transcriptional regulator YafY